MTISRFVMAVALTTAALIPVVTNGQETTPSEQQAAATDTTTTETAATEQPTGESQPVVNYYQPQSINQTPILNRPDRPGHPVGNTLRAINRGGAPLPMRLFRRW